MFYGKFSKSFRPDIDAGPKVEATIERLVLIGMAGMSAERKFEGRKRGNWIGGSQDMSYAVDFGSYLYSDGKVLDKHLEFMIARADSLVDSAVVRAKIEAVADALLDRPKLTSRDVRRVYDEVRRDGRRIRALLDETFARDAPEQEALMAGMPSD